MLYQDPFHSTFRFVISSLSQPETNLTKAYLNVTLNLLRWTVLTGCSSLPPRYA